MIPSHLFLPADRLVAALTDPARRERTIIGVIVGYVVVWTLYGVFAKASQDIHFDMAEVVAWSREPAFGYSKHPPLAPWLARAWFAIFPATDWAYYLLAMLVVGVALYASWRLFARYLDDEKRVVALAMLTLIPLLNFQALKFNPNTVLIPLWALTTLWLLRSYETRGRFDAALAGVGAAGCMLGKYWSIFLLAGLVLAALIDRRRMDYFRSAAPWITVVVGAIVLAPHVVWLVANDFLPFTYAMAAHAKGTIATLAVRALGYLAGGVGYIALPLLLVLALTRPNPAAIADILRPSTAARRFAALAFWLPFLLPVVFAPLLGIEINSIWTMSAWTLLPVVLLSSPQVAITRDAAVKLVAVALVVPFAFLAASPLIAGAIQRSGVPVVAAQGSLLAAEVAKAWKGATDRPLRYVGGEAELTYAVAFYLPDRPSTFPDLSPVISPWIDPQQVARSGIALVCLSNDTLCLRKIEGRAGSTGRRTEVELSRNYFGMAGAQARYTIIIVPPAGP